MRRLPTWRGRHFIILRAIWRPTDKSTRWLPCCTLGGTFDNVQGTAQGDTLADIVAKVKNKTFGDTLGNVKAQGLVDKLI